MKKVIFTMVIPLLLQAQSMSELFDALKAHSQVKVDTLVVEKSKVASDMVDASLYPKVNLFASYDNYNTATGMLPVAPNDLLDMVKDQSIAQPFSTNIYRAGANFSMPVFSKSIYTMAKKAKAMQNSAEAKKEINIIKNEAILVSENANFIYLVSLKKALNAKEKSLLETKKTLQIKVKNGRSAASVLYKIDDSLNEIEISKNNIDLQKQKIISKIESLTGISLSKPVYMKQIASYKDGEIDSLKSLEEKIKADKIDVKVQKEKLYPALFAHGSYVYSNAKAYNNDKNIDENYANIGLVLNIPILQMDRYESISMANVNLQSSKAKLQTYKDELNAESKMLSSSLSLLNNSIKLYKQSIKNKKELLNIAKVNFNTGRISTEEYLRYEDAVVIQEANLYKTEAIRWQTHMRLAVIYANNIEEMVK